MFCATMKAAMYETPKQELSAEEILLLEEIVEDDFICTHVQEDDWGRALVEYFDRKWQA